MSQFGGEPKPLPDEVVAFLQEATKDSYQQADDISVAQASVVWGVSRPTAHTRLRDLVKQGKLKEFKGRLLTGLPGFFYRRI